MQSVTEIIKPIALLRGSHDDTAKTGSGCFMNVVAYLNGEPQITDQSPCVCVTVRPIVIGLNDLANDEQRQRLVPFIERAMGSATEDRAELIRRAWLAVDYAKTCRDIAAAAAAAARYADAAARYADAAARYADAAAARYAAAAAARYAAAAAARYAAAAAARYAAAAAVRYTDDDAAAAAARAHIFEAGIVFLDGALPPAQPTCGTVRERAAALVSLAKVA